MKSLQLNFLLITVFLLFVKGVAQSDDQSNGAYKNYYIQKTWNKLDENNDGKFTEKENVRSWKYKKKLDRNNDNVVSHQEYINNVEVAYLNIGGERKLNVLYKITKEENLYLDIYYPKNFKKGTKLPVVFYTHGGGWAAGNKHGAAKHSFKAVHKALLEKGFCVVSVGYRLWNNKKTTTFMRDCVIDCKDAMRFLSKNSKELSINKNKFYSFGDSAGGQISQMLLLSSPKTLKGDKKLAKYSYKMIAGVSWYGPCDFEKTNLFNYDDRPNFSDRFGGRIVADNMDSQKKLDLYKEMSPINYLKKNSAPLLMIQGDKDTTIPVKHAYYMDKRAKEINATVTTLIVKNAGHNWRKVGADIKPTRQEIIQTTIDFFVSHLN